MATIYDIATVASLRLGGDTISSFSGDEREKVVLGNLWQPCLRSLLSQRPWSFATAVQSLNRISPDPAEEHAFEYAFQLPSDLITIRYVAHGGVKLLDAGYVVRGQRVYSDFDALDIVYIRDFPQADVPLLPHWFNEAFALKLAADSCESITGVSTLKGEIASEFTYAFKNACRIDASQEPPRAVIGGSNWTAARVG